MITIFNRESLWIGRDMKRFNEMRDELERVPIPTGPEAAEMDGRAMARPVEALEAWEVRLILCMSMKSLF